jgi:hypothetical protein
VNPRSIPHSRPVYLARTLRSRRSIRRGVTAVRLVAAVALAGLFGAGSARSQVDYRDFNTLDGLRFAGTAMQTDSVLDLNGLGPKLAGAVWYYQKQPVAAGFSTTFVFHVADTSGQSDVGGAKGGDGLVFVIQNSVPAPVGGAGGLLGYDGIRNSIAVELDTYENDEPGFGDRNGNHVSVHTTGTGMNSASESYSIASNTDIPNLSDGRPHTVTIEYVNHAMRIYLDGCAGLLLALPLDIERRILLDNGRAWVGFTAATGSAWERHVLHSWVFNGHPLPTPTRVSMCEGASAHLTPSGRFASYVWSTGARTPSIDVSRAGRYSVDVIDSMMCVPGEFTYTFDVVQSPNPHPRIAQSDSMRLCANDRVTLDGGAYSAWLWSTGEATRQIVVSGAGTYWVSVIDSLGCTGSDTVVVVVAPRPLPSVTITGPTTFCAGDSVTLDAGAGFASYRWSNGATTRRAVVRSSGSYTVTVTNAEGCPATSQPVIVKVLPRPYPIINALGRTTLCRGERVTLDAGAGFASYRWSNGATTPAIQTDTAGTFTVTVTNASGCSATSAPVSVLVVEPPTPVIIASPAASLCTGDTVTLRTKSPYASYRWSSGATSSTITVTGSGVFTVDVIDSNGCAGTSDAFAVSIDSIGVLRLSASGPTDLCEGATVTLRAPERLARYRWSTGDTTSSIVVERAGTYALFAVDSAGCSGSDTISVRVHAQPHVLALGDTTLCEGASATLRASGGASFRWSPADGLDCDECAQPVATPSATTRYQVVATNPGGCADTASVLVTVLPAPHARVRAVGDHRAFPGETVEVPLTIDGPIGRASAQGFTVDIAYDAWIMLLKGITLEGAMLTGWTMQPIADAPGHFRVRFISNDGRTLGDDAPILVMRLQTFIGWPMSASIRPTIELDDRPCAVIEGVGASVAIDSVCGVPGRLIEALDANALSSIAPNPGDDGTDLTLSLAAAAPARLEILSADGTLTAMVHDGALSAGDHRFHWDASRAPSGVYVVRASSGAWRSSRTLLIVH